VPLGKLGRKIITNGFRSMRLLRQERSRKSAVKPTGQRAAQASQANGWILRCVNLAVKDDRCRMSTLQDAIDSTRKVDYQVVFDLKSVFHHVRLHASS
jgi:hypothetical protein